MSCDAAAAYQSKFGENSRVVTSIVDLCASLTCCNTAKANLGNIQSLSKKKTKHKDSFNSCEFFSTQLLNISLPATSIWQNILKINSIPSKLWLSLTLLAHRWWSTSTKPINKNPWQMVFLTCILGFLLLLSQMILSHLSVFTSHYVHVVLYVNTLLKHTHAGAKTRPITI